MEKRLYIAYGSNMNTEQMARRCPTAQEVGVGYIENYALRFHRGFLDIVPQKAAKTPVVVWELLPEDEEALDRYEGYPKFYGKQEGIAIKADYMQSELTGMAYIMRPAFKHSQTPSGAYYYVVEHGYAEHGIDDASLTRALAMSLD